MMKEKYTCKKSKGEILEIIVRHFYEAKENCENATRNQKEDPCGFHQAGGEYLALYDLLCDLKIYEQDEND